jgi:transcriptional regulator with XRE-family HTH domain
MRRLQVEREARGWTRFDLGAQAHVHPPRVGQIENGRATPAPGSVELVRLARALDVEDASRLLDEVVSTSSSVGGAEGEACDGRE